MAKTILNNEKTNAQLNLMLTTLRSEIVYDNKKSASVYLAGIHSGVFEALTKMGIKFDKKHHGIKMTKDDASSSSGDTVYSGTGTIGGRTTAVLLHSTSATVTVIYGISE